MLTRIEQAVMIQLQLVVSQIQAPSIWQHAHLSLCPSPKWHEIIHEEMPCLSTFVDVGANKGTTARDVFDLWSPWLNVGSGAIWMDHLLAAGVTKADKTGCGTCRDCCDNASRTSLHSHPRCLRNDVHVYSFDGNEELVRAGNHMIGLHYPQLSGRWHFTWSAVSNSPGYANFTQLGDGSESGSMVNRGSDDNVEFVKRVPVVTLDHEFFDKSILVDVVKIDTEGHDFSVIQGAHQSMRAGVKILEFEYGLGFLGPPLQVVVSYLDYFKFSCWFAGEGGLVALTASHWRDEFDFFSSRSWLHTFGRLGVNVFCVSRTRAPTVVRRFEAISLPLDESVLSREKKIEVIHEATQTRGRMLPLFSKKTCRYPFKLPQSKSRVRRMAISTWQQRMNASLAHSFRS